MSDSFQVYVKVFAGTDLNATGFTFQIKIDETSINLDQFTTSAARSTPAVGLDRTIKDFKNGIKNGEFTYGPFLVQCDPQTQGVRNAKLSFESVDEKKLIFNVTERSPVKIQFATTGSDPFQVKTAATRYAPTIPLSGTNPQSLFGSFLRIDGTASGYRNVGFFLAKPTNNVSEVFTKLGPDLPVSANGQWGKELDLSSLGNSQNGTLGLVQK